MFRVVFLDAFGWKSMFIFRVFLDVFIDFRSGRNLKQMECSLNIDRKMFWELPTDKLR